MKKIERNPEKFEVIDLFDSIGQYRDLRLNDEESIRVFLKSISFSLHQNSTPTMLYGRHVEAMFGYVSASLGWCSIVKKEDDGDAFLDIGAAKIPDYRLITKAGNILLVEIKNFHAAKISDKFVMNRTYLDKLKRYASENNVDLKIAIYWSKMNIWTLLPPTVLEQQSEFEKLEISLQDAIKYNEMGALGDVAIGTTPSLSIKVFADKRSSRMIEKDGTVEFRIGNIDVMCNEQIIVDKYERYMAVSLVMFGDWIEEPIVQISDGQLETIEFIFTPVNFDESQGFAIIGFMSSIISKQYKMLTAPNGAIERITPKINTGMLGFIVPEDYCGKQLPLWRFHIKPKK